MSSGVGCQFITCSTRPSHENGARGRAGRKAVGNVSGWHGAVQIKLEGLRLSHAQVTKDKVGAPIKSPSKIIGGLNQGDPGVEHKLGDILETSSFSSQC